MTLGVDFYRGFTVSGFFRVTAFGLGFVQLFGDSFKDFRRLIAEDFPFFVFFGHGTNESLKNGQSSNVQIQAAIVNAYLNVSFSNFFRSVEIAKNIRSICRAGNDTIGLFFVVAAAVFYNVVFHGASYRGDIITIIQ